MGQWEYQIFAKGAESAGDQIWLARYLLERTAESYDIAIDLHPKPIKGDWNGSGMHANFSNGLCVTKEEKSFLRKSAKSSERTLSVTSAYMERKIISDSLAFTKPNRLINSAMEFRTVGLRFAFQSERFRTDGKVVWKTVVPLPMGILTKSPLRSSRPPRKLLLNRYFYTSQTKAMEQSIAFFIFFFA